MARKKGSFSLGGTLEILADAPCDARLQVKTKADLTAADSYPYKYIGMIVSVESEQKAYMLIGTDTTDPENWKAQGVGDIADLADVDLTSPTNGQVLKYNSTSGKWENADESGGGAQVDTMPTAGASYEGKILQYVGTTTADYKNGYFYECVSDGENPPTYSWVAKDVQPEGENGVELTQAEYDALSQEEKMNGTVYYITDSDPSGGGGSVSMSDISDVEFDSLADGQILVWDATEGKWINDYELGGFSPYVYKSTVTALSTTVGGTVQSAVANLARVDELITPATADDIEVGKTLVFDVAGTVGVATDVTSNSVTITTITVDTAPDAVPQWSVMPQALAIYDGKIVQYVGADGTYKNGYFYKCEERSTVWGWYQYNVQPSGGSGSAALETAVTSNLTVGGIASGTTLPQGTTFTEFAQKLLITEIAPTIGFSLSKSGNAVYGESYTETLTVNVTAMGTAKKIKRIDWYEDTTAKHSDTIDSTVIGSWTYTMDTATTDSTTFKAIVTYLKSDDTEVTVTKTATISFFYNKFYGVVEGSSPDEAIVEALSTAIGTAKGGTYSFTTIAARICYAYPKTLGALTSIKDGNGFSLFDSFTRTEQTYTQNGSSVVYYRYVLTDATTVSAYSVTFA